MAVLTYFISDYLKSSSLLFSIWCNKLLDIMTQQVARQNLQKNNLFFVLVSKNLLSQQTHSSHLNFLPSKTVTLKWPTTIIKISICFQKQQQCDWWDQRHGCCKGQRKTQKNEETISQANNILDLITIRKH